MNKVVVAPHNDDETLFCAGTLMQQQASLVVVFDSFIQVQRGFSECTAIIRRRETKDAMFCLGVSDVGFLGFRDDAPPFRDVLVSALKAISADEVWLPAIESEGHAQHNLVGEAGQIAFRDRKIHYYLTYTTKGKSTWGRPVKMTGWQMRRKLQALACYRTQIEIEELGCWPHFMRDQTEYLAKA